MKHPFHLSLGVRSIADSVRFFVEVLGGKVAHEERGYTNIEVFGHQITLKPHAGFAPDLPDFHFGFNLSAQEFDRLVERVLAIGPEFVHREPQIVDGGTPMERRKMYLKCPTGYLVELKGVP